MIRTLQARPAILLGAMLVLGLTLQSCGDDDKKPTPVEPGDFVFRTEPYIDYTRIDRMGMPAVATALLATNEKKEDFNDDDPVDDVSAGGKYVPDFTARLAALHNALDAQLIALGKAPATVLGALQVGGPLIVPDVLTLNTAADAGFPNGRKLDDLAIDITLAVLLLDKDNPANVNWPRTFGDIPLNPDGNAGGFRGNFPYLFTAH